MTIVREPFAPGLRPLHERARAAGGAGFADALCEAVEDAHAWCRLQGRGAFPPIKVAEERSEATAIAEAARALLAALWKPDGPADAEGRQRWHLAGGSLFEANQALASTADDAVQRLLQRAEHHLAELPTTRAADYVRTAIMVKLQTVFRAHAVKFTATAGGESGHYRSLAVDATMVALDASERTAYEAVRKKLQRTGKDSEHFSG